MISTESGLLPSDPISAMRPAVYPPVTLEGRPTANDNSPFHFDQELGESAGLYKPAVPDPQHHTGAYTSAATSAKPGPASPFRNLAAQATGAGLGLFTPFSHAVNTLTSALRWKPLCQSPQPFYAQIFSSSLRARLPQASHAPPDDTVINGAVIALQRFTALPNAHLHGGTGVRYKQKY